MMTRTAKSPKSITLDAATAHELAVLAQQWQLSEADALRRAIRLAYCEPTAPEVAELSPPEKEQALAELRASLAAQGVDFDAWVKDARAIRRGY